MTPQTDFPALPKGWTALALAALCFAWLAMSRLKYPSAPGPFVARFSNIWYARKMLQGHFEKENVDLHRKHGKIVRVGPKLYSIDGDVNAAKIIYGHGTQFIKGEWYKAWQIPKSTLPVNLFALLDSKQHASVRRQYANLYAMSSLVGYEPYVDSCVDILCRRLREFSKEGERIDLAKWFQYYAFDVIGEITFSRRFGFMETGRDIDNMIQNIGKILEVFSPLGLFPVIVSIQNFLFSLGRGAGGGASGRITAFASARIREAKQALLHGQDYQDPDPEERGKGAPDFCSKLIALTQSNAEKEKEKGKRIAPTNVDDELLIRGACRQNIFAGSDTTSISLNATLFNIITHPAAHQKLRIELDEAAARGELSDPPTFAETQNLPYLQACIKEALRMHPATGLPLWRQVPQGGATICGQYFPEGTNVGINSWVAHRNHEVWGKNADEFRPERWLESSEDKLRDMNALHMPFGLGSRTCIGKNISLLEISKVIPQLVRKFDIQAVGAGGELPARCAWFVKQDKFMVQIKERQI